jgi:hypothetical protein
MEKITTKKNKKGGSNQRLDPLSNLNKQYFCFKGFA